MKAIRRVAAFAAAVMVAGAFAGCSRAETTAESITEKGRIVSTVWKDETGSPAAGPEGYAEIRYTYRGADTTEMYYDAEGKPFAVLGGYYGRTVTRDGKKRVTGITFLDSIGDRAVNALGYSYIRMEYTSFGEVKKLAYYAEGKKPGTVPSLGYASITTEFSGKSVTRRTWEDENGNPVETPMGYAVMRQKLNDKHQVIRTRFEHADGSPAVCPDGWSICEQERDGRGRVIRVSYFDTLEQLSDHGAGYAREEIRHEKEGQYVTRFTAAGEQVPFQDGVMMLLRSEKDDRIVSDTYLDANGEKTAGADGVSRVEYIWGDEGSIAGYRYYDIEGNQIQE